MGLFLETEILPALLSAIKNGQTSLAIKLVQKYKNKIISEGDLSAIPSLESFL